MVKLNQPQMKKFLSILTLSLLFVSNSSAQIWEDFCLHGQLQYEVISMTNNEIIFDIRLKQLPTSVCGSIPLFQAEYQIEYNDNAFTAPTLSKVEAPPIITVPFPIQHGYFDGLPTDTSSGPIGIGIFRKTYYDETATALVDNKMIVNQNAIPVGTPTEFETKIAIIGLSYVTIGRFKMSGYDGTSPYNFEFVNSQSPTNSSSIVRGVQNSSAFPTILTYLDYDFIENGAFGNIYNDLNQNCTKENNESGIQSMFAIINPGNIIVQTYQSGNWGIDLPPGNYSITADTTNLWSSCIPSQNFTITNPTGLVSVPPIGISSNFPCPAPNISVSMPFMRPCFGNQPIYISVCNSANGTSVLNNPYVILELDSLITITQSDSTYTDLGNNNYQIDLSSLNPGQCTNLYMLASLSCDAVLGQGLCLEAVVFPVDPCVLDSTPNPFPPTVSPCTSAWDNSSLAVTGYCQNDSIYFEITNVGGIGADMTCYAPVMVYLDGVAFLQDSILLNAQGTTYFTFPGNGESWHLETFQHPLHPGNSMPSATVENCGGTTATTIINQFAHNDADPFVDIYCNVVTGSYDPNDKRGFPLGVSDDNLIRANQQLQYMIRFQNTGTDTAFTVVVRDTLETDLDLLSFTSGTSSHDYNFRLYGNRILEWTFNHIMLPDSNINEPASHGFLMFTIDQVRDLPVGTTIENSAGIYFDFNDPIITNVATHTIYDVEILSSTEDDASTNLSSSFRLYPNPVKSFFTIDLQTNFQTVEVSIFNTSGQQMAIQEFRHTDKVEFKNDYPPGIYFVQVTTNRGNLEVFKILKN